MRPSDCGWSHESREGIRAKKLIDYLDIISITAKEKVLRFALYTSRAEFNRTYRKKGKQGAFCEVEAKRCQRGFYDITKYSTYEPGLPADSCGTNVEVKLLVTQAESAD